MISCDSCGANNMSDVDLSADGKLRCILCLAPFDDGIADEDPTPCIPLLKKQMTADRTELTIATTTTPWSDAGDWATSPDPLHRMSELIWEQQRDKHRIAKAEPPLPRFDATEEEVHTADFLEPMEPVRDSQNVPLVFERATSIAPTLPSIPVAKRRLSGTTALWVAVAAMGLGDAALSEAKRLGQNSSSTAAAAQEPAHLPIEPAPGVATGSPAPVPEEVGTVRVEDLPVVFAPSASIQHRKLAPSSAPPKEHLTACEILSAAASAAFQKRDLTAAQAGYLDALVSNPKYFPARLGIADVAWEMGERASARQKYRKLTETYPRSMLPSRVLDRAAPF